LGSDLVLMNYQEILAWACITYAITKQLILLMDGIVIIANWPYTLIAIMPTNKKLFSTSDENVNDNLN